MKSSDINKPHSIIEDPPGSSDIKFTVKDPESFIAEGGLVPKIGGEKF